VTGNENDLGERVPFVTTTVNSYGLVEAESVKAGTEMVMVLAKTIGAKVLAFLQVGSAFAGCLHVHTYVKPWSSLSPTSGSREPDASRTMGELYATSFEVPPAIIAVSGVEITLMSKVLDVVCAALVVTKQVSRTCEAPYREPGNMPRMCCGGEASIVIIHPDVHVCT
jgi:hypothetical protein